MTRTIRILVPLLACAALLAAALAAPEAQAGRTQESIFQDEGLLQFSGPEIRRRAVDDISALGADTIHALVGWRNIAPAPGDSRKPADFDASDPGDYPSDAWDALDDVVRLARERNMDVLLSPTGAIPDWASRCGARANRQRRIYTCDPDPREFQAFVTAVGRRYSGELRVRRWSFWNEPNLRSWLRPQYKRVGRRNIPWSPVLYRELTYAGIRGLQASGHGDDQIMMGEAAPIGLRSGNSRSPSMAPGLFLRETFCLDARGRRYRGSEARARRCTRPRRFAVRGITHHPYARGGSRGPQARVRNPDEITVGYAGRLQAIMRQATRARMLPRGLAIYYTEYGVQTSPPDRFFGVSLARQAEYINESDYLSWKNRSVRAVAQYNLIDDEDEEGFQTGLRFNPNFRDGADKPAYAAYRTPIYVVKGRGSRVKVWGQTRPGGAGRRVEIQNGDGREWRDVQTVTSGTQGYFIVDLRGTGKRWRLVWADRDGATHTSREAVPRSEPRERR